MYVTNLLQWWTVGTWWEGLDYGADKTKKVRNKGEKKVYAVKERDCTLQYISEKKKKRNGHFFQFLYGLLGHSHEEFTPTPQLSIFISPLDLSHSMLYRTHHNPFLSSFNTFSHSSNPNLLSCSPSLQVFPPILSCFLRFC